MVQHVGQACRYRRREAVMALACSISFEDPNNDTNWKNHLHLMSKMRFCFKLRVQDSFCSMAIILCYAILIFKVTFVTRGKKKFHVISFLTTFSYSILICFTFMSQQWAFCMHVNSHLSPMCFSPPLIQCSYVIKFQSLWRWIIQRIPFWECVGST